MRAFIAIDLPQNIKDAIFDVQQNLRACEPACKWVEPANIHMTLKFLGNISTEQFDKIKIIIGQTAQGFKTFNVSLTGFGFFPNERRPRVFYVSTSQKEMLCSIATCLEAKLEQLGFAKDARFKPHLTLARIKEPKNIDYLKKKLATICLEGEFAVNAITLYKSTLTTKGPIYETMARIALAV